MQCYVPQGLAHDMHANVTKVRSVACSTSHKLKIDGLPCFKGSSPRPILQVRHCSWGKPVKYALHCVQYIGSTMSPFSVENVKIVEVPLRPHVSHWHLPPLVSQLVRLPALDTWLGM
jgi:hypothetical protein